MEQKEKKRMYENTNEYFKNTHLNRERLSSYKKKAVPSISSTVSTIDSIDISES